MNNEVAKTQQKGITPYLNTPKVQQYLKDVIGNNKDRFTTNLISVINQNKSLQKCTNISLMSGAIVATTLNLSLNSAFGYAYLVPFKNNKASKDAGSDIFEAQFQIGYKGYIQLALRTGEYKRINAVPIYKSQFKKWNALTEELELNDSFVEDEVVGYVSYFKLNNGFEKTMYWSYDKMLSHADTYSQAFNVEISHKIKKGEIPEKDLWKYSSYWYKDFDGMALKTMLRQILSKYGIMSEEMQKAYEYDQSVINENEKKYIDNEDVIDAEVSTKPKSLNDLAKIDYSVEVLNKMIKNNVHEVKAKEYLSNKSDEEIKQLYIDEDLFQDECMDLIL